MAGCWMSWSKRRYAHALHDAGARLGSARRRAALRGAFSISSSEAAEEILEGGDFDGGGGILSGVFTDDAGEMGLEDAFGA